MLLAIDVGNTSTHVGVWDGRAWRGTWRRGTAGIEAEAEFAGWLSDRLTEAGVGEAVHRVVVGSVVRSVTETVVQASARVAESVPIQLADDSRLRMPLQYDPPSSLGADRLANALAARASCTLPVLVVDIGSATTFDAVDRSGAFVGGAIMPGPALSAAALTGIGLPEITLDMPPGPIGNSTVRSLRCGVMLGHAAAIQGLATRIVAELGGDTTVVATGGLGEPFISVCPVLTAYHPTLTLDGLVVAHRLLSH
ncbi:MAG: type III pantothenate kinase [Fimbriimonadaceae bacterium]